MRTISQEWNKCFGEPIEVCCSSPMTGYFRWIEAGHSVELFLIRINQDTGTTHTVCAVITDIKN